jgi:hypothetical protein
VKERPLVFLADLKFMIIKRRIIVIILYLNILKIVKFRFKLDPFFYIFFIIYIIFYLDIIFYLNIFWSFKISVIYIPNNIYISLIDIMSNMLLIVMYVEAALVLVIHDKEMTIYMNAYEQIF